MAPRGRPRKAASRMDAAIRAMIPLGFQKEIVRAKVKHLLKEYKLDGYSFIEENGYQLLVDAILADKEEEDEECGEVETSNKHGSEDDDDHTVLVTTGPSRAGVDSLGSEIPNCALESEKDEGHGNPVGDVPVQNPVVCADQPSVAAPSEAGANPAKRPRPWWWPSNGEEYKPPVVVYSPGKPLIPANIVELFRNRLEENTPVMAPPPALSEAGTSKEGESQERTSPGSRH